MKNTAWTWRLPTLGCLGLLALGCGPSGDVDALDDGTFTTFARGYHGEAGERALEQAEEHCRQMGLEILVDEIESRELDPGFYRATLTFRCVDETHPDLQQPE
ncbi:hypothetical protein [Thioalkalivibrio thiocyanodenitrificans]|uniref:hypothetical protein n=1 Tax=Thioalkalivibrio thiocyanodenitrificans TaxID=243063 RepID=UPI000368C732|nr:hypothetical protein [Thioalkalivibrio thiocyanodenitrificans]